MGDPAPGPRWPRTVTLTAVWLAVLFAAVSTFFCLLVRPGVRSVAAPLLGPWAGLLWGHEDCTMAHALPLVSWGAVGLGVFALGVLLAANEAATRMLGALLTLGWTVLWCGLAVLSLINSTE